MFVLLIFPSLQDDGHNVLGAFLAVKDTDRNQCYLSPCHDICVSSVPNYIGVSSTVFYCES